MTSDANTSSAAAATWDNVLANDAEDNNKSSNDSSGMTTQQTTTADDHSTQVYNQTMAQMEEIAREVQENQPLTSERRPLSQLESQYCRQEQQPPPQEPSSAAAATGTGGNNFLAGLKSLQQKYDQIRTVRGDGNCYYRAFLYSLAENMMSSKDDEGKRILLWVENESWKKALAAGYDEMTLEAFYDTTVDLLKRVSSGQTDLAAFHKEMNEENGTSDYCTWYLRVVVATYIKADPDRFLPFVMSMDASSGATQFCTDLQQFCAREVEPMGKECEQIQVLALAEALGVQVKIAYLDGRFVGGGDVSQHCFGPENAATRLTLLYRPGHYDILYPV